MKKAGSRILIITFGIMAAIAILYPWKFVPEYGILQMTESGEKAGKTAESQESDEEYMQVADRAVEALFTGMSVYENLMMGAFLRKDKDGIKRDYEKVCEQFPILKERMNQDASTLSGGEQQMLAMGRALMAKPKLLLLDEPSMGLAPILVKEIFNIIEEINKAGTTVLLVEQNAKMALSIAHRAYVLETGKVVMSGTGEELAKSSDVQKAYLGG